MGNNAFGPRDVNGNSFIELKKAKTLDGPDGDFAKATYWLEAFLAGCKTIVVGMEDNSKSPKGSKSPK
jgi:hypothetical protein